MLRHRIELLERVLRNHGIDVEASVAELIAEAELSNQQADPNHVVDDLCVTFDGALTIDESLNFDQDGEVRYFGPTSGRLLFQSSPTSEWMVFCVFFLRTQALTMDSLTWGKYSPNRCFLYRGLWSHTRNS